MLLGRWFPQGWAVSACRGTAGASSQRDCPSGSLARFAPLLQSTCQAHKRAVCVICPEPHQESCPYGADKMFCNASQSKQLYSMFKEISVENIQRKLLQFIFFYKFWNLKTSRNYSLHIAHVYQTPQQYVMYKVAKSMSYFSVQY